MPNLPNMSKDIASRIAKISGMVVGRDGKGGSGTCVCLENGRVALLTAKHVVIDCILNGGGILIAIPTSGIEFHTPRQIRMDSTQQADIAFLESEKLDSLPAIPFKEWTNNNPIIEPGLAVSALGFPGVSKRFEGNRIHPTLFFLPDAILSVGGISVICGINERIENIPPRLDGMSGGGLFAFSGAFLGTVIEESRNISPGRGDLVALLPSAYPELYKPFTIPPDRSGPGFNGEDITVSLNLCDASGTLKATISSTAQTYWSPTNPDQQFGRVGRLSTLEIIIPGVKTHYPINIESMFYYWPDDSHESRRKAVQEEFEFLLMRMGWLFSDSDKGPKTRLKITPLI